MELKEAILERRSVRKYTDKAISIEDLTEIVEMGTWAPSGTNRQNWHFVVCASEDAMARVKIAMECGHADFEKYLQGTFPDHPKVVGATMSFIRTLGNAKACVLAFLKSDDSDATDEIASIQSVAAALENMALFAHSKGIGSCWIAAPLFSEDSIRKEFAEGKGRLVSAMTFGYYDGEMRAPARKPGRIEII